MPKERILVVDDETNIANSLKEILSDEGYDVSVTEDGLNALDMIQSDPPDLLLLDVWLPGMDGIEVLRTVKTYHPEIEVLVMSGHGTIDTAVKATKLGAFDFIEKPFSMDSLTQSVKSALGLKKKRATKITNATPFGFSSLIETQKAIKFHSQSDTPLLFLGESGTGKEYIAQAIHQKSAKSNLPFIKLNCSSRTAHEINSFLFPSKKTSLEYLNKTLDTTPTISQSVYLDNVDALSKTTQQKLFDLLFSNESKKQKLLPSRLYISSSQNLSKLSKQNQFNPDLLKIFRNTTIRVPSLRENSTIIPALIRNHLEEVSKKEGLPTPEVDSDALEALCQYHWPENIRELHSVLDRILATAPSRNRISLNQMPPGVNQLPAQQETIKPNKLNNALQRTLKRSVVLYGSGLHKGLKTGVILQPLPPKSGIIFSNISNGQTIPARLENIKSTNYSTTLHKGKASVATIEHIMAVLHMYRITNLLIKVGDEVPVMDGSSKDFCELIENGGIEEQDEPSQELIVDKKYTFGPQEPGTPHISIEPSDTFKVSYHMEYPTPIGIMDHTFEYVSEENFKKEIAPARTFGFMEDIAQLTKMGFASGGNLDNFILLGDGKIINTELRFKNEFPRHKILDILGDFYLLGKTIRGHIRANKSGHTQNIGLLKTLTNADIQYPL